MFFQTGEPVNFFLLLETKENNAKKEGKSKVARLLFIIAGIGLVFLVLSAFQKRRMVGLNKETLAQCV